MSRILKAQDIHVNPAWIEESKQHIARICEVAIEQKVDAITIAGDFFHKPVMASDKSNWDEILQMARDLQKAAPVYYVHGTPSHDSPGTYSSFKDIGWEEVTIGKSHQVGDLMIMGIPEITQSVLATWFPELSRQELIVKQYELINFEIDSYYGPLAKTFKGPVLFMGHGHIAGTKFRDDQKPRSSDFMYSEEMLKRTGATDIQFGHIHLPQKYYGGSAHITWGDIGFRPGFDVITYNGTHIDSERFYYGEPQRQKITVKNISDLSTIESKVVTGANVWIDIECDKEFSDQYDSKEDLEKLRKIHSVGPLSKITCNVQHVEHVRIDTEEYEKCSTLEDLYKIYDPEVSESILHKVKEAEENTESETEAVTHYSFGFPEVWIRGSKVGLESGIEEIHINAENFQTGANLIVGPNGKGKSFSMGFCHPFSEHLPTGTDFKTLFSLKNSQIIRKIPFDGGFINQRIDIDPTLANPTAKYYMDINGDKSMFPDVNGNKKPFDIAVAELFGSTKMFMTCAFRGQKENSNYPSLENAKETDLRDIFSKLLGADRKPIKDYAHEKAAVQKKTIELDLREIETLEAIEEDPEIIKLGITERENSRNRSEKLLASSREQVVSEKEKLSGYEKDLSENESTDKQMRDLAYEKLEIDGEIKTLNLELSNITDQLKNADDTRLELKTLQDQQIKHNNAAQAYFKEQGEFNKSVDIWNDKKSDIDKSLEEIRTEADKIKSLIDQSKHSMEEQKGFINVKKSVIESANDPCEHCGKISSAAQEKIDLMLSEIKACEETISNNAARLNESEKSLSELRGKYKEMQDSISKKPDQPESLKTLKKEMEESKPDAFKISQLEKIISGLKSSEDRKVEIESLIDHKNSRIIEIRNQVNNLQQKMKKIDMDKYESIKKVISETESDINRYSSEIGRLSAEIESLNERMEKYDKRQVQIKEIKQRTSKTQKDVTEWEKIESAFAPKGIPALELSLTAPIIDKKANSLLSKYNPRYSVEIITQDFSKNGKGKDLLEKFKILVHDNRADEPKNLPVTSGGQAVWATTALSEAINSEVVKKTGREYLYKIIDEQDGALDNETISTFYDMINSYLDGKKKLISISHNPEAKNTISSVVDITDFFTGYGE